MIRLICFDLDNTLCEAAEMHFESFNSALKKIYPQAIISREEHLSTYNGLPTAVKLKMLSETKGLPVDLHDSIWNLKQMYTEKEIDKFNVDYRMRSVLKQLKDEGYKMCVVSNSIKDTIRQMLTKKGLMEFFDFIISNQDVKHKKPHPEMYLKAMIEGGVGPKETLIIEDSPVGIKSGIDSGGYVCEVKNPYDLTYERIKSHLDIYNSPKNTKYQGGSLNVVIPMAGKGSRFAQAGYTFPKPLIPVNKLGGKPMIQVVVENLNIEAKYIYIVQKEHYEKYNLKSLLNLITPNCEIVQIDEVTEGAACTVLLAEKYINNDSPLFIANSDQFVEWDSSEFFNKMKIDNVDGGIATFKAYGVKWSYAKLGKDGNVCEVAEKNPISEHGSVGFYYSRTGKDWISATRKMILNNRRYNNEFYVCPVYNELISDGKKVCIFPVKSMSGLGTPEDLNYFEENYGK